jgi:hypothetical protein
LQFADGLFADVLPPPIYSAFVLFAAVYFTSVFCAAPFILPPVFFALPF